MHSKQQVIKSLIPTLSVPTRLSGEGFAPTNIALCKYWGKRNSELNLPITDSLSISLGHLGANTKISFADAEIDNIILNREEVAVGSVFYSRITDYLDLFRPTADTVFSVKTQTNIPVAAGLASSACGFAALVMALCDLFSLNLDLQQQSILARLGSGSASRSFWNGFVQWQAGHLENGMDSYAFPLDHAWPELRVGLLMVDDRAKQFSSREAMQTSVETSPFYSLWPKTVKNAIEVTHSAIASKDFWSLGSAAEANSLAMHSLMLSATPSIIYSQAATIEYMHQVWIARASGVSVFFTQDAGPNLKLLFLQKDEAIVRELFSNIEIVAPFAPTKIPMECVYV